MNLYKATVEIYFASKPSEEFATVCGILDELANTNTVICKIEDTGEGVELPCCPAEDFSCPYYEQGFCTLKNCKTECDEWYGIDE